MLPQSLQTNNLWARALLHESNTQSSDVVKLLDTLIEVRRSWKTAQREVYEFKEKLRLAELKLTTTSTRGGKAPKDYQLESAREQIAVLLKENAQMKSENSRLKRVISSIQKGTSSAFDSIVSSSRKRSAGSELSTDFDATGETLDHSLQPKRPSLATDDNIVLPSQNEPLEKLDEDVYAEENAGPSYMEDPGTPKLLAVRRSRRSMSVPVLNMSRDEVESSPMKTIPEVTRASSQTDLTIDLRKLPLPTTPNSTRTPFSACIEYRDHIVHQKRAFARLPCGVCTGVMRFGTEVLRCKGCKVMIHVECRENMPKPCIPYKPPSKDKTGRLRIIDYCADARPRLPFVVLHCVRSIDTDLNMSGLYRSNPGRVLGDEVLTVLLQEPRTSMQPLNGYDVRAVAQGLLNFLHTVRDSVIPFVSHEEFYAAAKSGNPDDLEVSIVDLPAPHKNTLAYLFLHWQRLVEHAENNGCTVDVISKVIAPVILRDAKHTDQAVTVVVRLLAIDKSVYESILEDDVHSGTPLSRNPSKNSATRGDFFQRTATMSQMAQRKESLKKK